MAKDPIFRKQLVCTKCGGQNFTSSLCRCPECMGNGLGVMSGFCRSCAGSGRAQHMICQGCQAEFFGFSNRGDAFSVAAPNAPITKTKEVETGDLIEKALKSLKQRPKPEVGLFDDKRRSAFDERGDSTSWNPPSLSIPYGKVECPICKMEKVITEGGKTKKCGFCEGKGFVSQDDLSAYIKLQKIALPNGKDSKVKKPPDDDKPRPRRRFVEE